ncbi:MAG: sugar phosphate isomerase/epimerase family protein, partial [Limisphaerales bacterium]
HAFIPPDVQRLSPEKIEKWAENYLLKLFDLAAELKIRVLPMFWGVAFGWEIATGYPWGFWQGPGYDLIEEGKERFVKKTAKLRKAANERGIKLCHEIHPGTAAMCAADFHVLVQICDGDPCLGVNADPSHCWEGESSETRFLSVASRIYAAHVKNHVIRRDFPVRAMQPDWPKRAMQFTDLASGDLNMFRYAEMLILAGYPKRYCDIMGTSTAPLVVEAESAHRDLDATSANGIAFVRDNLCFPVAGGSFEEGMGA